MLVILLMGFSSGLPYMLIADNIALWFRKEGIDLTTIGFMVYTTLPYSLKFFWSYFMDRYSLSRLGRRRSWILASQLGLIVVLSIIGRLDPHVNLYAIAGIGILGGFLSASQDIAIDAYRIEM